MIGSTTQEPLMNSNRSPSTSSSLQKDFSSHAKFLRTPSTLEPEDFSHFIQQEYGAMWGTLKFEDSLSDYSNEVLSLIDSSIRRISFHSSRHDHFSTWMIILIFMHCDTLWSVNGNYNRRILSFLFSVELRIINLLKVWKWSKLWKVELKMYVLIENDGEENRCLI